MRKIVFIFIVAGMLAGCVGESKDGDSIVKTGAVIPSFSVSGPYGTVSSADYSGKGGVLVFFASYCSTCRAVLPQLEQVWQASGDGALFTFAAMSRQTGGEDEDTVAQYWLDSGYSMPYYLDQEGGVYYRYAKQWIPRIYVIDRNLVVTYMSYADTSVTAAEIIAEIEKATDTTLY